MHVCTHPPHWTRVSGNVLVQLPGSQVIHLNSACTVTNGNQWPVLGPVAGGQWRTHAQGGQIGSQAVVDSCQHHVHQQLGVGIGWTTYQWRWRKKEERKDKERKKRQRERRDKEKKKGQGEKDERKGERRDKEKKRQRKKEGKKRQRMRRVGIRVCGRP